MYMYYLLGYRLFELESRMPRAGYRKKGKSKKDNLPRPIKSLFNKMNPETYASVSGLLSTIRNDNLYELAKHLRLVYRLISILCDIQTTLNHRFIIRHKSHLTLDGDVDFKPESAKLLVDGLKKNRKVGAVCGRIHPIGSGK